VSCVYDLVPLILVVADLPACLLRQAGLLHVMNSGLVPTTVMVEEADHAHLAVMDALPV
jgi:hypothetical protein